MNILKVLVAFPLAWLFWFFGHTSCLILEMCDDWEPWCRFWYPVYNYCMIGSLYIQEWASAEGTFWPWGPPTPHSDEG